MSGESTTEEDPKDITTPTKSPIAPPVPKPTAFDELFVLFTLFVTGLVIFCICRSGLRNRNDKRDRDESYRLTEMTEIKGSKRVGRNGKRANSTDRDTFYRISISDDSGNELDDFETDHKLDLT